MDGPPTNSFSFSGFEVDTSCRRLTRDGKTLPLNAKAFDLLVYLAGNAGRVISKDQLLSAVWQDRFVEEANLAVQISALRRALGDRADDPNFIVTVPGQGYEFIAKVDHSDELVISDHKVSRVVVEETITSSNGQSLTSGSAFLSFLSTRNVLIALSVVGVVAAAAFWFSRSPRGFGTGADAAKRALTRRIFPTSGGIPHFAAVSPDGKDLAYVINRKGQVAIRIGQIDGGDSIQISPYADRFYKSVTFSPDSKGVYATIRDANHPLYTLIRMSVLGGARTELGRAVDSQITFSPDGKNIAFIRREHGADKSLIVIADAETGKDEHVLLVREKPESIVANGISWSPDGTMIAFAGTQAGTSGSTLFAANVSDGTVTKICSVENKIDNLVWLRDQSGLILNRSSGNGSNDGQIWRVSYPNASLDNLSNDTLSYSAISLSVSADNKLVVVPSRSDAEIWTAPDMDLTRARLLLTGSWARREGMAGLFVAPDGKILFTARSAEGGRTIWEMDSNGEGQHQLIVSEKSSHDGQVGVTADDMYVVFQSDRTGTQQIWRANRDGSDMRQLTVDGDDEEPVLSPDGTYVLYTRYDGDGPALWRMPVRGGEPTRLTTGAASWPSISPDGKFIACQWGKDSDYAERGIAILPADGGEAIRSFSVPPRAALYNRLMWAPDGRSILYKDETQGLWKQELDKDKPEPLIGIDDFRFYHMASSNTDLIYSGGVLQRDIEIIEGF